jgi:hypothetical protein
MLTGDSAAFHVLAPGDDMRAHHRAHLRGLRQAREDQNLETVVFLRLQDETKELFSRLTRYLLG